MGIADIAGFCGIEAVANYMEKFKRFVRKVIIAGKASLSSLHGTLLIETVCHTCDFSL